MTFRLSSPATMELPRGICVLLFCCLLAAQGAFGSAERERVRWNVVVLVPDTVRGDHVSANGYPRETTPSIDALAAEGANFTQAVTVAPRTWQSFTSILTGRYPPHHGVRHFFNE
ncbi:MAG: sulfatase-like hydrolase/transferase, partial [Planctomycetota bacterium]